MSELPAGWEEIGLLELSSLIRGVTYGRSDAIDSGKDGYLPVLRATNITDHGLNFDDLVYVPSNLISDDQRLRIGDVVIATSSGSATVVGKACQVKETLNAGFGAFCGVLRPKQNVNATYFGHFFKTKYYRDTATSMARGVNINNLKRENFEAICIPLAPLTEQKRIADKLDALLAKVDACRQRLDRVPALIKRFRQAVLAAATAGDLTADWRDSNKCSDYEEVELGEWCDVLGGKRLPKGFELTDQITPYPYVRVTDFDNFTVKVDQLRYVPEKAYPYIKRYIIQSSDIYISIAGTIGVVGQVPKSISGANLTENAARIVVNSGFLPKFLMYQLASPSMQRQMHEKKIATTQDKLGLFRIKDLKINKPEMSEQAEIVRRVESLFAFADRLEARYAAARKQADQLTPALLAKAFRGELVPQDPNDEPASALLDRIRADRATQGALFAGAPKRQRKS